VVDGAEGRTIAKWEVVQRSSMLARHSSSGTADRLQPINVAYLASLQPHEIANLSPGLESDPESKIYNGLRQSIAKEGLIESIVFEGKILDGVNQYGICCALGAEPHFVEFKGTFEKAVDFSIARICFGATSP
jgi:hypothetical protein